MKPLVSIIMAAHNGERWIAESIRSALAQTWSRKEILIMDDGSTDQTLAVARRFASKDVSVLTQPNQGAGAARNRLYAMCQGDYIQMFDQDDLMAHDKIARQLETLERCGTKRTLVSSAWGYFYYRPHKAEFTPTALWCDLSPVDWLLRKMTDNLHMQGAVWLISRELMEAGGLFDVRLTTDDDGEFSCRLILASDGIRFVPEAKLFYRRAGSGSLSDPGRSNKRLESIFRSVQLQIEHLRGFEDSERVRQASLKYLQIHSAYFYPERLDILREMEQLAVSLGGQLETPKLSSKYAWIRPLVGYTVAKRTQAEYRKLKSSVLRHWDKAMLDLENRFLRQRAKRA